MFLCAQRSPRKAQTLQPVAKKRKANHRPVRPFSLVACSDMVHLLCAARICQAVVTCLCLAWVTSGSAEMSPTCTVGAAQRAGQQPLQCTRAHWMDLLNRMCSMQPDEYIDAGDVTFLDLPSSTGADKQHRLVRLQAEGTIWLLREQVRP